MEQDHLINLNIDISSYAYSQSKRSASSHTHTHIHNTSLADIHTFRKIVVFYCVCVKAAFYLGFVYKTGMKCATLI